jgi:hypothetical protein
MSNALSKPNYIYKRFRVKRADGGSTTVSIDPSLVVKACAALGSLSTVSRIVREAATTFTGSDADAAKNRSAHVARTLWAVIEGKDQPANAPTAEVAPDVIEAAPVAGADSAEIAANSAA